MQPQKFLYRAWKFRPLGLISGFLSRTQYQIPEFRAGLKTNVRLAIESEVPGAEQKPLAEAGPEERQLRADLAASFQVSRSVPLLCMSACYQNSSSTALSKVSWRIWVTLGNFGSVWVSASLRADIVSI